MGPFITEKYYKLKLEDTKIKIQNVITQHEEIQSKDRENIESTKRYATAENQQNEIKKKIQ